MIPPILTQNSEVWWSTFLSQISIAGTTLQWKGAHSQFCKRYLEVHNKALSMASRSELGKYPMIIDINKKILNSLRCLQNKSAGQFNSETIFTNQSSFATVVKILSTQI